MAVMDRMRGLTCSVAFALLLGTAITVSADEAGNATAERQAGIERFEELLERYPDSEMRAPIVLMLGNLYAEREKERYLVEIVRHEDGLLAVAPTIDYNPSIALYEEIIEKYPAFHGRAEALFALGVCYEEMGQPKNAEGRLEELVTLSEDPVVRGAAHVRLADIRFDEKAWSAARFGYLRALEEGVDPAEHRLDYKIGWCLLKEDNLLEAGRHFRKASDRIFAGLIEHQNGRESLLEVLRSLALVQSETDPSDVTGFGARFEDNTHRALALREFGDVLLANDRPKYAEIAYKKVLALEPLALDAPTISDQLIECYSLQNKKNAALESMEEYCDLYWPGSAWEQAHTSDQDRVGDAHRRVERNLWNAALLRYTRATNDDYQSAAKHFERYVHDLGAEEHKTKGLLFAAEAWYKTGEFARSAGLYDSVPVAGMNDEERESVLHGAFLSHRDAGSDAGLIADAALRYWSGFEKSPEAQKTVLYASEQLESSGDGARALELSKWIARQEDAPLRGEAALRAGKIASVLEDAADAEIWFKVSAEAAGNETERKERVERAGASAFLQAQGLEEAEQYREAVVAYRKVRNEYAKTAVARDALRREFVCCVLGEDHVAAGELVDTLLATFPDDEQMRDAFRAGALKAHEREEHSLVAVLLDASFQTIPDVQDRYEAARAWDRIGNMPEAEKRYRDLLGRYPKAEQLTPARWRLAHILDVTERYEEAGAVYDLCRKDTKFDEVSRTQLSGLAAEAYRKADLMKLAEDRWLKAVEHFRVEANTVSDSANEDLDPSALYAAKALRGLADLRKPGLDDAIRAWRKSHKNGEASTRLDEYVGYMRELIAIRIEGMTRPAVAELADCLEWYGRTAFQHEWERTRVPAPELVEPFYTDAAALYESDDKMTPRDLYAALADSVRDAADIEIAIDREALGEGASNKEIESYSEWLVAWLGRVEFAEERRRTADALYMIETERDGESSLALAAARREVHLEAADALNECAHLLRTAPAPGGLTEEEGALYRSVLEERGAEYQGRALAWMDAVAAFEPPTLGAEEPGNVAVPDDEGLVWGSSR